MQKLTKTDEYYLQIADAVSIKSKCLKKHYGAIIVKNNESLSQNVVNGLQEFGILLFKADKSGDYSVKVSNISYGIYNSEELKDVKEVSTKVKVISDDNFLKSIMINDVVIDDFDNNKFN